MATFLKSLVLTSLEPLVNRSLVLDPNLGRLLKPLQNKIFAFRTHSPGMAFSIVFSESSVHFISDFDPCADVTLSGSGLFLVRKLFNPELVDPQSPFRISGDAQLLQHLAYLLKELNPQWEESLSRVIGDAAAHTVGQAARSLWAWSQASLKKTWQHTQDYLRFDAPWLVRRPDADAFADCVDRLKMDSERLEIRIARIEQKVREAKC